MKKRIAVLLSIIMILATTPFVACKKNKQEQEPSIEQIEQGAYLTLNSYSVKLKVGETFLLDVKKYNEKDEELSIDNISFKSDTSTVANINDGIITAVAKGETYINVIADGLETAIFVSVQSADLLDGLVIRFSSQKLYQ